MPEAGFDGDGDGDGEPRLQDGYIGGVELYTVESENEGAYKKTELKKNPENALQKKKKKRSQNKKSLTHSTQLPLLGELSADVKQDNKSVHKKALQKDMKTSPEMAPQMSEKNDEQVAE